MYASTGATTGRVETSCVLDAAADAVHSGSAALTFLPDPSPPALGTLTAQTVLDLPSGGAARIVCQKSGPGSATFSQARILAIKVATLN